METRTIMCYLNLYIENADKANRGTSSEKEGHDTKWEQEQSRIHVSNLGADSDPKKLTALESAINILACYICTFSFKSHQYPLCKKGTGVKWTPIFNKIWLKINQSKLKERKFEHFKFKIKN